MAEMYNDNMVQYESFEDSQFDSNGQYLDNKIKDPNYECEIITADPNVEDITVKFICEPYLGIDIETNIHGNGTLYLDGNSPRYESDGLSYKEAMKKMFELLKMIK